MLIIYRYPRVSQQHGRLDKYLLDKSSAQGSSIMEFKALRAPALTEEVAIKLEARLNALPGVEQLIISLETQELHIVFDENRIGLRTLVQEMANAGCPLRNINAALFM